MKNLAAAFCALLFLLPLSVFPQFSAPRLEYVEHLVTTDHPDRVYAAGENAKIYVRAYKGGLPLDSVWLHFSVGPEMMPVEKSDSVLFRRGMAVVDMGTMESPGFRACNLQFHVYDKSYKDFVKVGFSPERITGLSENPSDFDDFWRRALDEAAEVAFEPQITPVPEKSTDEVEVSKVRINIGKNGRHFYGYLTRPRDGRKHPVLFCPPGAGASRILPYTGYSKEGFIYLNINIHDGCDPQLDEDAYIVAKGATEGYNRRGIEHPDSFYYRKVYAGCSRVIDFLCSLPDWDGRNVGVTGGSQGGALTLVTAALNPRVTFCVPYYPALCDLDGFRQGRAGGWPKYFKDGGEAWGAEKTLPYYDVVNFSRRVKCPVFFSFGFNDETCSPTSTYAAYNAIPGYKVLEVTPTSGHWRFPETNDNSVRWMLRQLK